MPTPTTELGLQLATATDDQPTYLVTHLAASLTTLDDLFNVGSGHTHNGPGEGAPINGAGIADGTISVAKLTDPYTQPEIVTPTTFPPATNWRIYPKADGQYYKINSTGTETPLAPPTPDPLTIGTLIVTSSATTPPLQQAEAAATPATLPPAGSRLLYPKVDGFYYTVDSAGTEAPLSPLYTPPAAVALTGSMHQIGSTMIDQIIAALVTHGIVDDTAVTP